MTSSKPFAAGDDPVLQRLYHGTRADLKPGDKLRQQGIEVIDD